MHRQKTVKIKTYKKNFRRNEFHKAIKTQACKPGSVFHSIIYLGLLSPTASSSLPLTSFSPCGDETRAGSPVSFQNS